MQQRLRVDTRTRLLSVVVVTTSDDVHDIISSYKNGVSSHVRKPVNFAEFLGAASGPFCGVERERLEARIGPGQISVNSMPDLHYQLG